MRVLLALAVVPSLVGLAPAGAQATQTATLAVGFSPYRLKTNAALTFTVKIGSTTGAAPSPVTSVKLRLPDGLGLSSSQIGLAVCNRATLHMLGVAGCPPEAVLGGGSAVMEIVDGSESLEVPVELTAVMAPAQDELTTLLFYAEGRSGVIAELVFPGSLIGDTGQFGEQIDLTIPPIATIPGDPPASLVSMRVTVDPKQLLYPKQVGGKREHYHPKGMAVPSVCPVGGFPFAADFRFADNTSATAATRVACPPRTATPKGKRHAKGGRGG